MTSLYDSADLLRASAVKGAAALIAIILSLPAFAHAQRRNQYQFQLDLMGGANNWLGTSGLTGAQYRTGIFPFYAVMPTLAVNSAGEHSSLDASYSFGAMSYQMREKLNSTLHQFDARANSQLSGAVSLRLTDAFRTSPDFAPTGIRGGAASGSEGFRYLYDPLVARRTSLNNTLDMGFDFRVSPESTITVDSSFSYLHYENIPEYRGFLSDQLRFEETLGWTYGTSGRQSFAFRASAAEIRYREFDPVRTYRGSLRWSRTITPVWSVQLEAGPAYTQNLRSDERYPGGTASAGVTRRVSANQLSLNWSYRSGDTNGMGSTSDTHSVRASFSQLLGTRAMLNLSVTGLKGRGRLDNPMDTQSLYGAVSLAVAMNRHMLFVCGGDYGRNRRSALMNFTSERAYVAFRLVAPAASRRSR